MEERPPTNEEIIEELTQGLKESAVSRDSADEKFVDADDERCTKDEEAVDKVEAEASKEEDIYFVDENVIKDRDSKLSDEELEDCKKKADVSKVEGNKLFQNLEFKDAAFTYTEALQTCPLKYEKERAVLYANRAAAKAQFMPDKSSAIDDCTKAIELDSKYVKCILRRARYYEDENKLDEALADYKKIQEIDSGNQEVVHNINRLNILINERNEKLKEEMLGKLKDLGNLILKPFGLSTNNFQMEKDEASGGYSVKFNQNS